MMMKFKTGSKVFLVAASLALSAAVAAPGRMACMPMRRRHSR